MKKILRYLRFPALVGLIVFVSAMGPEIHSNFLRAYVGTKTVTIKKGRSGGSGFFVKAKSGKSYILTNKHVCRLSDDGFLDVVLPMSGRRVEKEIIEMYTEHDLCLIEGDSNYTGLDLASFLYRGQTIGLMGHPKLQPLTLMKGEYIGPRIIQILLGVNVSEDDCDGEVQKSSGLAKFLGVRTYCVGQYYSGQITAYSRGGSSGSPVINFFGNIVGVLFAGNRQDQFESYIVLLEDVRNFLENY